MTCQGNGAHGILLNFIQPIFELTLRKLFLLKTTPFTRGEFQTKSYKLGIFSLVERPTKWLISAQQINLGAGNGEGFFHQQGVRESEA